MRSVADLTEAARLSAPSWQKQRRRAARTGDEIGSSTATLAAGSDVRAFEVLAIVPQSFAKATVRRVEFSPCKRSPTLQSDDRLLTPTEVHCEFT